MEGGDRKPMKRTTAMQFEMLVNELTKHPKVARGGVAFGKTKADVASVWEEISQKLNSHGPPSRGAKEWKKVWIDFKGNVRGKCAANKKKIQATGGGPLDLASLSPLEAAVEALLDIGNIVNPEGRDFGEGVVEDTASVKSDVASTSKPRRPQQQQKNEQTQLQKEISNSYKNIEANLGKSVKILREIKQVKVEKLKWMKSKASAKKKLFEASRKAGYC